MLNGLFELKKVNFYFIIQILELLVNFVLYSKNYDLSNHSLW